MPGWLRWTWSAIDGVRMGGHVNAPYAGRSAGLPPNPGSHALGGRGGLQREAAAPGGAQPLC